MKKEKKCQAAAGLLKCSLCGKEFRYESDRKRHESSHNPQFMCKVCSKSFSFLFALRRHEKQHSRSGSAVCEKCTKTFRDHSLLKRHLEYAHKGTFICQKCLSVFNSEAALRTHSLTHKPVSERRYHCSFDGCKKSFNFSHHLRNHELTHTNEKKYFCNVCGKGFIQPQNLKNHLNTHEPDALLCCTVKGCKKKFATEYTRRKHVATHNIPSNEKRATLLTNGRALCPSCGDLVPKRRLDKHILTCLSNQQTEGSDLKIQKVTFNSPTTLPGIDETVPTKGIPGKSNYCKTALGSCMVSGGPDMEDNCLCAQMSTDIKVFDNNLDFEINAEPEKSSVEKEVTMQCCSCDCGRETIDSPRSPLISNLMPCKGSMPSLEFRSDGVIKLRETIDVNIPFVETAGCKNIKTIDNIENSCKAVLGNCIVSGDDTIGEGCLCARMAAESQAISEQEIEEITIGNVFDS